jgi:4-alpha-glucanotransferase
LHPTSLPGRYGIGDLGPAAYDFLEQLAASGCGVWQVMPLGPTGYGDSPYQCFSAFAGNPLLISPDLLEKEGILTQEELAEVPEFSTRTVDYGGVYEWKTPLLEKAFANFEERADEEHQAAFEAWTVEPAQDGWLQDYALFRALKDEHDGAEWVTWDPKLAQRDPQALNAAADALVSSVRRRKFYQWVFFRQWHQLQEAAGALNIRILGDVPIFVAHDSADAWSHPEVFHFDRGGHPTVVAGVPPDYFSETGQLWGNPLYRWEAMEADGFRWWIERLRGAFRLYDMVRLDHFRGFQAYWEVPAGEETAINGQWVEAPGKALFETIRKALPDAPIVAEDLGVITPEVEALRDDFAFPGMKILQFAFGGDAQNEYLPHNIEANCVVYTGTHDNDTTLGWYEKASEGERNRVHRYLGSDGRDICWELIRLALGSVARTALVPMQDLLEVGTEGRMNLPGRSSGNWAWRLEAGEFSETLVERLKDMNEVYGRLPPAADEAQPESPPSSSPSSEGST